MALQSVNEQRIVIKLYILLENQFSKIQEDLHAVYKDSCLSNNAILKRMNRFKDDRETTKNDKHILADQLQMTKMWLKFKNTFLKIVE